MNFPSIHPAASAAVACQPKPMAAVGLICRVQRIESDIHCGRPVSDDELQQFARDCTFLMESAYDRFQAGDGDEYRAEAMRRMHQRDHALQMLSPAWKAAREARIQEAIAQGAGCYFMDAADRDREAVNEEEAQ